MLDILNLIDFSFFSKGLWTVVFIGTVVLFSVPIIKLFGQEGTWARARETAGGFIVIFLAIGLTPQWIHWLLTALWWLYETDLLMWGFFFGSLIGLGIQKARKGETIVPATVFVPSLCWVFGFVVFHEVLA